MMVMQEPERLDNTPTEVSDGDLVWEVLGTPNSASVVSKNGGTEGGGTCIGLVWLQIG